MKKYAAIFLAGFVAPIVLALYAGGENLAQVGLRLAAVEQGFALASRHWQFEASPAQEVATARWYDTPTAQAEPLPAVKKGARKR